MTKNMTRKSLALGAAAALVVTGFSAMPVNAAGLADTSFVALAPTTGTEYAVLASATSTFSLTANEASTVSVGNLKHLVTDASGAVEPVIAAATEARMYRAVAVANNSVVLITVGAGATDTVKITDSVLAAGLTTGDSVYFESDLNADDGTTNDLVIASDDTAFTVTVAGDDVTFTTDVGLSANTQNAVDVAGLNVRVIREARHATNTTYVVDSGVSSASTTELLVLASTATTTRSVTVQSWMDANGNDLLDSTEYASPVRTVTFKKASEVVAVTTMAPIVGATKLSAVITTTPVLNGEQTLATNPVAFNAAFTRSLSTLTVYADNTDTSGTTSNTSSVWDDDDKTFTVEVNTDADAAAEADDAAGNDLADSWGTLTAPTAGGTITGTLAISTSGVVSVVTSADTNLVSGDKITMTVDAGDTAIATAAEAAATVTVTGARTFSYNVSETTFLTTAVAAFTATGTTDYVVVTYTGNTGLVDRVGAETYGVQATVAGVLQGNIVTTGVSAAVSATTTIATESSSSVQGLSFSAAATNTTKVLAGTLSVPVTITVTNSDGDAVGAGRAVALALSGTTLGTYKVNGKSADTVLTDANGQVAATVTTTTGTDTATATLTATAENVAVADIDLVWAAAVYGLVDLSASGGTLSAGSIPRNIIKLGSYSMNLMVADQWFNVPAAGTYRLNVSGEGVSGSYVTLVDGKAMVTANDTGVFGTSMDTIVKLEKLSGSTVTATSTFTFEAALSTAYKVAVGAAGTTLYGNTVVASVAVAKKALVEIDSRTSSAATPAYANNLVLNGMVSEKSTSAAKSGAYVTVSGPSNILFESASVEARGSLTLLTGTDGKFEIKAYSTTAQTDSVITFTTSDGATGTIKVSFTGTGIGEGTVLTVTTPAAVKPASTFQVKAKLADAYGNAVNAGATAIKVTYTGPGIVFGTLPTTTDANGELQFAVLLGSNDTGTITVTVSYDQNGDLDYVDTKDLVTTATTVINATGVVAADAKVNAGSFKGYVALYAAGHKGKKMSAIVAGKWIVVPTLASDYERVVRFTGAGYDIVTTIYIDGVMIETFNITTK